MRKIECNSCIGIKCAYVFAVTTTDQAPMNINEPKTRNEKRKSAFKTPQNMAELKLYG